MRRQKALYEHHPSFIKFPGQHLQQAPHLHRSGRVRGLALTCGVEPKHENAIENGQLIVRMHPMSRLRRRLSSARMQASSISSLVTSKSLLMSPVLFRREKAIILRQQLRSLRGIAPLSAERNGRLRHVRAHRGAIQARALPVGARPKRGEPFRRTLGEPHRLLPYLLRYVGDDLARRTAISSRSDARLMSNSAMAAPIRVRKS